MSLNKSDLRAIADFVETIQSTYEDDGLYIGTADVVADNTPVGRIVFDGNGGYGFEVAK